MCANFCSPTLHTAKCMIAFLSPRHGYLRAGIAVLGGALASKYISEKTINLTGGALFLLFAGATAYSLFP